MAEDTLQLSVENVGGIEHLERSLSPGITFVQGPNASNKSSFLKALLFALGVETVPIRSGADEARVVLTVGETRIERTARRTEGGIAIDGEAWIDDPADAVRLERFAGLLETNSLRSAIARSEDIESLLKEPMDIESLEAERRAKLDRKRTLEADLSSVGDLDAQLAEREEDLADTRARLATLDEQLEELHAEQEDALGDDDIEGVRAERADLRSDERECETEIERLETAIERLEDRAAEIDVELAAAREATADTDVAALERERESVRDDIAAIRERLDVLQTVLTANREMLGSDYAGALGQDAGLLDDELRCWACGGSAPREAFEETVEDLTDIVSADKRRLREREPEIEALTEQIEDARRAEREIDDLEAERRDIEDKLANRRDSLVERREQLETIRDRLGDLDDEIAAHEADQQSETTELTTEIEETRVERQTVSREIDRLEDACADLRERRETVERKRAEVDDLGEEITALTDRIENLETELRDFFNDAMDDLLDVLAFEDIERVWLDGEFDLVIAREVDGSVRTDSIDHLAESEREMIGFVLGFAGFVTFDVDEVTPVLVLDSLGAFDADRTPELVEYFAAETDYLVASAHPELGVAEDFDAIGVETAEAP